MAQIVDARDLSRLLADTPLDRQATTQNPLQRDHGVSRGVGA
jgi:hypothetical protein